MSKPIKPATIYRKDYTAPAYWVDAVEMGFDRQVLRYNTAELGISAAIVEKAGRSKLRTFASDCYPTIALMVTIAQS